MVSSELAFLVLFSTIANDRPLKDVLQPLTDVHPHALGWTLALTSSVLFTLALGPYLSTPLRFVWNCFLKPLGKGHDDQSQVLDAFYAGQADVYDATRTHLLKGREDMLQLLASHLKAQPAGITGAGGAAAKPKIWVDIGGGTGWNIEKMWVETVSTEAVLSTTLTPGTNTSRSATLTRCTWWTCVSLCSRSRGSASRPEGGRMCMSCIRMPQRLYCPSGRTV